MRELDVKGLPCPQPVIRTKEILETLEVGEKLKIILDSEPSFNNVKKFLISQGHTILSEKIEEREFILLVEKGTKKTETTTTCDIISSEKKKLFLIVTKDHIGNDENLGKFLVKSLFETMITHELLPNRIFFMNTGVFLTTKNDEIIELLKQLEHRGTEIFTCGTCLKYYKLEDELKVGKRGGTDIYLEGIFYFEKIIWIG